jgi:transglutaminase-like putative cysteine protease
MNFDKFFKFLSYAVVFCGFLALWISGGSGLFVSTLFLAVLVSAWYLEEKRWQVSEKVGTVLMIFTIPLFYLDWKYRITGFGASETAIVGMLAKLILFLTAIKLFQKKGDRDWLFLYLMSFFEVLLAAGISISPSFLASLILYLAITLCAIVAFEIRKTSRIVSEKSEAGVSSKTKSSDSALANARASAQVELKNNLIKRLPSTAIVLLFLIIVVAAPLFFAFPRVGGAGLGSNQNAFSSITGFSDTVNLGQIGQLKQNDQIVMRARIENAKKDNLNATRWRGTALDTFNNRSWSKSSFGYSDLVNDNGRYWFDRTEKIENITLQTVYLEPIDSPVLFILSRPLLIQGNFMNLKRDSGGAINFVRNDFDHLSYTVASDTSLPPVSELQADNSSYSIDAQRYLALPEMDERIASLAAQITEGKTNRYDKAAAVEKYLQNEFGYTLDLKAGGDEPLADFLFNVKEGHCEYFATAMAIMLRTQGVATRIVNGFQLGEYNETADVYVVKQRNAHSWVEVYFPGENVWVPFDPTPFAGQNDGAVSSGILGSFNKYMEALETFWIQYFVAYDNQEQRSLFRSVKNSFRNYQAKTSSWLNDFQAKIGDWWKEARGDKGFQTSAIAIAYGIGYLASIVLGILLIIWLYRKIKSSAAWQKFAAWLKQRHETTIVEFYERMQKVLASKGFRREPHQTPLEFAFAIEIPEAISITEKYNRVRFGEKSLSHNEAEEIENWLKILELEKNEPQRRREHGDRQ